VAVSVEEALFFCLMQVPLESVFTVMKTVYYQVNMFFLDGTAVQTHLHSPELSMMHAEKLLSVANVV
jgi:hypothetical protein